MLPSLHVNCLLKGGPCFECVIGTLTLALPYSSHPLCNTKPNFSFTLELSTSFFRSLQNVDTALALKQEKERKKKAKLLT